MNRTKIALLALGLLASTAFGQEEKRATLSLSGGVSFPSQPSVFSDYWKMGFNFGASLGYALSPFLTIGGSFDYNNFAFDEEGFLKNLGASGYGITVSGASASIISVMGNLKVSLTPASVSPYFFGGLGFSRISLSDATISGGGESATVKFGSNSVFSVLFGAGLDIPAGKATKVFLQGAYGIGFKENGNTNYLPVKFGVALKL
jgi:hypothetical protein